MNDKPLLRWIGLFFFVLVVSLLVMPAGVMLMMAVTGAEAQRIVAESDGDPIVLIGFGNVNNQQGATSARLARTLANLEGTPAVTDVNAPAGRSRRSGRRLAPVTSMPSTFSHGSPRSSAGRRPPRRLESEVKGARHERQTKAAAGSACSSSCWRSPCS